MELLILFSRLLLAAVMGVAGIAKIVDLPGSRKAMRNFGIPTQLAPTLGLLLPLAEMAAALLLLFAPVAWYGAILSLALLLAFIAGISANLARGRTPHCHCFGQLHSAPIGWPTLARNGVLALVALWLIWQGPQRIATSGIAAFATTQALTWFALLMGSAALVVAALEGWFLLNLLRQNGRLLLRIEALETKAGVVPTSPAASKSTGLPVGSVAPPFSLSGLHGETLTLDSLRAAQKPLLLVFIDPHCGPCKRLVPEIVQWQRDHATVTIVPISRGKAVGQQEQMQGLQTLLLQKDQEVAQAYQVTITPSAVLVNADGTIASLAAAGPDEIRALLATATRTPQPAEETIPLVNANRAIQLQAPRRGDLAPAFQLPDLNGNVRDLESFQGEPVLILFWNPGCSYCRQMLDDMKALEHNHSAKSPRLLLVSTGSSEANEAMELQSPILLDSGFSMARVFGARGTPSAVLVDAGGRIASEVAAGRDAILALLSQQGQTQEPISI